MNTPKQIKSSWYYVFWAIATASVCIGQYYVGSGYREMAKQQKLFADAIYSAQMGWGAYEQDQEILANRKLNRTGEYE